MYKYEYEKIKSSFNGRGPLNGNSYQLEEYQNIIHQRAIEGWRYVGYIPTRQRGTGHIEEMDLIFEKEVDEQEKS